MQQISHLSEPLEMRKRFQETNDSKAKTPKGDQQRGNFFLLKKKANMLYIYIRGSYYLGRTRDPSSIVFKYILREGK